MNWTLQWDVRYFRLILNGIHLCVSKNAVVYLDPQNTFVFSICYTNVAGTFSDISSSSCCNLLQRWNGYKSVIINDSVYCWYNPLLKHLKSVCIQMFDGKKTESKAFKMLCFSLPELWPKITCFLSNKMNVGLQGKLNWLVETEY